MLRRLRDLENWTIEGVGGDEVGTVENFYVDDLRWTVRYIVANTGGWLTGRQVLISPMSVRGVDEDRQQLPTNLARDTVKNAPSAQLDRPITRGHEVAYSSHYGYSYYWMGGGVWGAAPTPSTLSMGVPGSEPIPLGAEGDQDASHLHSVNELSGYHIQAVDGEIGHVEDLMVVWRAGPSATWSSTRATGSAAEPCWSHPSGFVASTGPIRRFTST